jgi:CubicO group peptidase (beta-lactamase class C family)
MQEAVLDPLGMTNSTYEQPLREALATRTANGYYSKGKAVQGKWHIYPEMAAAGLWTTPSDLAQFAIIIQKAFHGESNRVLSQSMTRQMLTNQKEGGGLGVFLSGKRKEPLFFSQRA